MKDEEILIQLELQAGRALGKRESQVIDELFAEEFFGVNSAGAEMTKADVIRESASTDYAIESFENENIQVRVIGDCAVVTAICAAKGLYKGADVSARVPYMRIWLKRDGRWQVIAAQSSTR